MRSRFYYEGHNKQVAVKIREYINASPNFLSPQTAGSPRAAGDALENLVAQEFDSLLGDWCSEYSSDFARDVRVIEGFSRKRWMLQLCDAMAVFYPREIEKIEERIVHFDGIRSYWQSKDDIWETGN